jgi:hypothetical protein
MSFKKTSFMVIPYLLTREVLGVGGPVDTQIIEAFLVDKNLTEEKLETFVDAIWGNALSGSKDEYKWEGKNRVTVNEVHKNLLKKEEKPILKFNYNLENHNEFNALIIKWEYPANGPIHAYEAVFNYYFNKAIQEYIFK